MQLFNLVAKISLDDEEYKAKIEEAKAKSKEVAEDFDKKHKALMVAGWAAVAVAVVEVIKKIANLAKTTIDYADKVGDLAEQWGFTAKEIQEFDYWATQNGTTLESLLTGMRGLVNQAEAGASAFQKLGVSVRNNDGTFKDQRTLFLETMTALQGVEDTVQRNALQFEIFGRAGIALGQVINKSGAELEKLTQKAQDYGLIISDEAIQTSSDFNDELDTLQRQFRSLVAELLSGSPEADRKFEEFTKNLESKIEQYLPKFIEFMVRLFGAVVRGVAQALPSIIQTLFDVFLDLDWFKLGWDTSVKIIEGLAKGLWEGIQTIFGKGWLWGTDNSVGIDENSTETAINTATNTIVNERTTSVNETLDISLSVESDGTVAGDKNLDTISDLMVEKINKALGDMVNG